MANRIVVWDPTDEFWEGSLIDPVKERIIQMRGGVTLPVDPKLFLQSGVGGYMRRSWGSGWPLDHRSMKICCPLTMFMPETHRVVHWAVRLVPSPELMTKAEAGEILGEGQLRLVGDSGQAGAASIALTPQDAGVDMRQLGKLDADKGWTFRGESLAHPPGANHYAFGLYGAAPGLRVAWAAISATEASAV